MGMENFMMALIDYPDECHYLMHKIAEYDRRIFERYLDLGMEVFSFSEDLGSQKSLMISPDLFRDFLMPEYVYIFEDVVKEKKIINFHSCGCVQDIVQDIASLGVTILNPIQAKANDPFSNKKKILLVKWLY